MNKNTAWLRWAVTGMAVAAIVVAALAIAPLTSFAQTDSGSDQPATPATPATPKMFGRGGMDGAPGFGLRGGMMADHEKYLAQALGITVEELQAAQEKAQAAMVAQAVKDGVITQEQADLMEAHRALGQYLADAKSQSAADALQAAVEAGAITQEQADLLSATMSQRGRGGMFGGMLGDMMQRGSRMFGDREGGMFNRGGARDGGMFNRGGGRGDFHHRGMPGMPWDNNGTDNTTPQRGLAPQQSDSNL